MTENLQYDERREWARMLYTQNDHNIRDTALAVNVDESTLRKWITEEYWDESRQSMLLSRKTQLRQMYTLLDNIHAQMKDAPGSVAGKDIDAMLKCTAAIKNLEEDITISQVIEVAEMFVQWLRRKDIDLTKLFTVKLNEFIRHRIAA